MADQLLAHTRIVLHQPQDPVNVAGVVRAMKNMGFHDLVLIEPAPYDPTRIEGVAHDTRDVVSRIRHAPTLAASIADCVCVAAFTARRRAAKRPVLSPREAAQALAGAAADGPIALLFGREDKGLSNEALDRANLIVTIPTTEHQSLNLAQAVLIALYEMHLLEPEASRTLAPPRKDAPAATSERFELLFSDAQRALESIDFFRTRHPEHIMRTLRALTFRAEPDAREIELLRAFALEVIRTLQRERAARP